jgi:polygalacturonase
VGIAIGAKGPTSAAQDTATLRQMGIPYDVHSFGAAGDGKTIDSGAINRASEYAARAGGGTVYLRAGNYLCYSVHLKSKVAIYLDQGATCCSQHRRRHAELRCRAIRQPWEDYQDYGHNR